MAKSNTLKIAPPVDTQIREACKRQNRLALAVSVLLGGLVPLASYVLVHSYVLAHFEIDTTVPLWAQLSPYLVLGMILAASVRSVDIDHGVEVNLALKKVEAK